MKKRSEYIQMISKHADELKSMFGIRTLQMEPHAFLLVRLKRFLEHLLGCPVDIVRMHKHINPYLLQEIEHDGIYVIR